MHSDYWRPQDRIPYGAESTEWNRAMGRRDDAIRQLREFAAAHPEHRFECLKRAILLNMTPANDWPLGTRQ